MRQSGGGCDGGGVIRLSKGVWMGQLTMSSVNPNRGVRGAVRWRKKTAMGVLQMGDM